VAILFTRPARFAATSMLAVTLGACSPAPPAPQTTQTPTTPIVAPPPPYLWGEMKPVVSVKELMKFMIDPVADNIFNAVGMKVTRQGVVEIEPKTDEDWDRVRTGAISLAEAAYLLKVRRPFTPTGDENNSQGPDAVELSPAQITAKVERDPVEWNARIEALRNVGLQVLDIVERRKADELWEAGENLEATCEACHRSYWYPGEGAEFYQKLRKRLEQFKQSDSGRGAKTSR